ncbi:hypothetical protein B0H22_101199 [Methanohalophilus euhalobius]|uniref:Lipoprotein n=1 Tax=Methanohalophilus euhalobius TaxID=51203 RepID=A0A314ZXE9_9EURY|nr:hypothetical protein B0H22_101199 [Methanohalophilus euhalobius]
MKHPIFLFLIIIVLVAGCISNTPQETEFSGNKLFK